MIEKVKSGNTILNYDLATGKFDISKDSDSSSIIGGAVAGVFLKNSGIFLSSSDAASRKFTVNGSESVISHTFDSSPVTFDLIVSPIQGTDGLLLSLNVINNGDQNISGMDFHPLHIEHVRGGSLFGTSGAHDYRFVRNGFCTWSGSEMHAWDTPNRRPTHRIVHDACHNSEIPVPADRGRFIGEWYACIDDNISGAGLTLGFTTVSDQLSQVEFKSRKGSFFKLSAVSRGERLPLTKNGSLKSETLAVIPAAPRAGEESGAPSYDAPLKTYARITGENTGVPKSEKFKTAPVGWCSWYYYFANLDEKVILQNLEAAQSLSDRLPIDVFQIDDGYEPAPGDWYEPTEKFPHGIEWLSKRIREAGFKAGLWLAPFFATHKSELFKSKPEWFVRESGGGPRKISLWPNPKQLGWMYGLDLTNPEVHRWLSKLFGTIVNDWGFDYLKLDFTYTGAIDGERYDPHATRAQAFRRGLQTIRDAAGPDTFILGCGIPLGLGLGICNGMRTSGDTAPYWHSSFQTRLLGHPSAPGVFDTAFSLFTRYHLQGAWGYSDPDCLMCRFKDTKLNGGEVLTHAAIVACTGGPLILSDDLSKLGPESIRLAQQLIPPLEEAATPIDLFESSPPATLMLKFDRPHDPLTVAARFNWSSSPADLTVDFGKLGLSSEREYHVYDLWEDRYHGIHRGGVAFSAVPPHGSLMLSIRPVSKLPSLVASTFHFTQGGIELTDQKFDESKRSLRLTLEAPGLRDGRVYIFCPEGYVPKSCFVNRTHETVLSHVSGKIFALDLSLNEVADVEIQF
ncbi:MAG TPA: alpha-galactosidase [bacterium]|nr:alpha-galactosidase [bacterium]